MSHFVYLLVEHLQITYQNETVSKYEKILTFSHIRFVLSAEIKRMLEILKLELNQVLIRKNNEMFQRPYDVPNVQMTLKRRQNNALCLKGIRIFLVIGNYFLSALSLLTIVTKTFPVIQTQAIRIFGYSNLIFSPLLLFNLSCSK